MAESVNSSSMPRADETKSLPMPPVNRVADDADVTFEVTVPEGVKPGDKLQATTPSGVKVKLVVPEKAESGMSLTFTLPKSHSPRETHAATAIQCRVRGKQVRRSIPAKEGVASSEVVHLSATPDMERAAVALQSSFRGHAVRNDQQEQSRLHWIE